MAVFYGVILTLMVSSSAAAGEVRVTVENRTIVSNDTGENFGAFPAYKFQVKDCEKCR